MANIYRQHSSNRSVGWSTWHLQWCTKYRYKVFYKLEYRHLCKVFLFEAAKKCKIHVFDCEIDDDHVHVIASIPLTMTPSEAIRRLKGFTSCCLSVKYPHIKRLYRGGPLWSPGKFMGSIGHITLEKAKEYLETHHAKAPLLILGIPAP